jgi:hypothetical protein
MKTKILLIFIFFSLIFINQVNSQNVGNKEKISFSELSIVVQAPDGWVIDIYSLADMGIDCLFYELGQKFEFGKDMPIIYISVSHLRGNTDRALKSFSEEEISDFIWQGKEVEQINMQYKNKNDLYLTYNLHYENYYDRYVYTRYKAFCIFISLSTNSNEQRVALTPKLMEVINSLTFIE